MRRNEREAAGERMKEIREGTLKELCMNERCIPFRGAARRWAARGERLKDRWGEVGKETEKEGGVRAVAGIMGFILPERPSAKQH